MPGILNKLKEQGKDNSYHPFAKEEKEPKAAKKPKPEKRGGGLLGLGNRKNTPHDSKAKKNNNSNSPTSDFLLRLSGLDLQKWEGPPIGNAVGKTDKREQAALKAGTKSRDDGETATQDYSGSYLFTQKPEVANKVSENKPTQLDDGKPVRPINKAKPSMMSKTESNTTNGKAAAVKIDENAYKTAKEKCLNNINKLVDYLERPPHIKINTELAPKFNAMQTELSSQLNNMKQGLGIDVKALSSDPKMVQSLSKLATVLDRNTDVLLKGTGKAPIKLTPIIESIKNEMLQFKESLKLLVNCLPHDTDKK